MFGWELIFIIYIIVIFLICDLFWNVGQHHALYTDRFYTDVTLVEYLQEHHQIQEDSVDATVVKIIDSTREQRYQVALSEVQDTMTIKNEAVSVRLTPNQITSWIVMQS